jgi:hypothetical protein
VSRISFLVNASNKPPVLPRTRVQSTMDRGNIVVLVLQVVLINSAHASFEFSLLYCDPKSSVYHAGAACSY